MDVVPQSTGGKAADADDGGDGDEVKEEYQASEDQDEEEDDYYKDEEHFTKLVKYKLRNTDEAALIKALGKFNSRPRSFCVHGLFTDMPLPGLRLGDNFDLCTPVKAEVLPQIVASNVMEDAPFGQGENTVLDPKVRSTLQASPNKCTFLNPAWDPFVQSIAERCAL